MHAYASRTSRFFSIVTVFSAASVLMLSSGCGSKSKAAAAQTPPPQTLSEPVRPGEGSQPSYSPSIPAASADDYSVNKGQSRELPHFVEPSAPPAVVVAPPAFEPAPASSTAAGNRVHTLSKGETLYGVSRLYNVKVKDLIAANNFKDPNKLAVGTKVYIP
jgi:LysM repeat protein